MGWEQKTLVLDAGWQTLRWTYSKDASGASGSDAGFVDQVAISHASRPTRQSIAAGYEHSAAIAADHSLWTWGDNWSGQLGLGDEDDRDVPTRVGSDTNWAEIAAGWDFTVALRTDGTLWSWGDNWNGQLGLGDRDDRSTPTRVGSSSNWVALAVGHDQTLALRADGTLWGWGDNEDGQLGTGDAFPRFAPTRVGTNTDWIAISGHAAHCLALRANGTLWAWGGNWAGQLGTADAVTRFAPTQVGSDTNWSEITAANQRSFAIHGDGTLWTWGGNWEGQLGLGDTTNRYVPTQIGAFTNWRHVAVGDDHALAIRSDGTLWSWGINTDGPLGQGDTVSRNAPAMVGTATNWFVTSGGAFHSLALRSDGSLWSTGLNDENQLGLGPSGDASKTSFQRILGPRWLVPGVPPPTGKVIGLSGDLDFGSVLVGQSAERTMTIFSDGSDPIAVSSISHDTAEFTGTFSGTIPAGTYTNVTISFTPTAEGPFSGILTADSDAIGGAATHPESGDGVTAGSLADALDNPALDCTTSGDALWTGDITVTHDGTDAARSGDVADGQSSSLQTTVTGPGILRFWWKVSSEQDWDFLQFYIDGNLEAAISGEVGWQQITFDVPGGTHTLEWRYAKDESTSDGADSGWVDQVEWISTAQHLQIRPKVIAADFLSSFAILADGTLWAWGTNYTDPFGHMSSTNVPTQIGDGTNWVSIGAWDPDEYTWEQAHFMGLRSDGTLWAWGRNDYGQLGFGNFEGTNQPAQVGSDSNWVSVIPREVACVGLRSDGTIWAWGSNQGNNLIGYGDRMSPIPTPTQVGTNSDWIGIGGCFLSTWFAIRTDGSLWSWGFNDYGQLGRDGVTQTPGQIGTGTDWIKVSGGAAHVLALRGDGSLWAWGANWSGQLGIGTFDYANSPVRVGGITSWTAIAAGPDHSLALQADGSLWAWGDNRHGKLGLGDSVARLLPTRVGTDTNWLAIDAGTHHSLALRADGSLWVAGWNPNGELGTPRPSADQLSSFQRVLIGHCIASGVALPTGRTIGISGDLDFGQIDPGQTAERSIAIFNDGDEALTIHSIAHSSPLFSGNFSGTIGPRAWVVVPIEFAPSAPGPVVASLTVHSDATAGTSNVTEFGWWPYSLGQALDAPKLTWTCTGGSPWFGTPFDTHDGTDAAQTGTHEPWEESSIQTELSGPGELRFWWKCSSQTNTAQIIFTVDGDEHSRISADSIWRHVTCQIPAGTHAARWSFTSELLPNGSEIGFGFLDEVRWVPDGSFAQWQEQHFSQQEILDPTIAGFHADPDKDGLSNGLEAVLAIDPRNGSGENGKANAPRGVFTGSGPGSRLAMSFILPISSLIDIRLRAQASEDLMPTGWTTIAEKIGQGSWTGIATVTETPLTGDRILVVIEDPQPFVGNPKRFLRLIAEEIE